MDFNWVWVGLVLNLIVFFSLAWKKSVFNVYEVMTSEVSVSGWGW